MTLAELDRALADARAQLAQWEAGTPHTKSYWTVALSDALRNLIRAVEQTGSARGW